MIVNYYLSQNINQEEKKLIATIKNYEIKQEYYSDDSSVNSKAILSKLKNRKGRLGKEITKCPHLEKKHYAKVNKII